MTTPNVLVIGRGCVDHIAVVDRYPAENTKSAIRARQTEGGGQGATAACCIRRLGGPVRLVGRLGDDLAGAFCRQRLEDFGVDLGAVQTVMGGRTPESYIFVTRASGQRTIFYQPNDLPRLKPADLPPELFRSAGVVLLDPETTYLAAHLPPRGPEAPIIVYDAERWREGLEAMMVRADFFIPSSELFADPHLGLAGKLFPEKFDRLAARVEGALIVTRGGRGAYFQHEGRLCRIPAPRLEVRDSIGAGDNFHAAFALGLLRGYDQVWAIKFAVAVASLSCRAHGGRAGLPGNAEALRLAETLEMETVTA
ncbi:MAG: PfkB family carbohydrate kinase [Desulfobacterales bacterium]|nr:PfkB family carbohydrate kinase [Desulfobacterales bacterium]